MVSNPTTRVLIVDDNQDGAEMLSELVRAEGYVTCTAYDGFMALDAALAFDPHVIILDLNMPKFSGDEVAPMLRQIRKLEDVYIIALSAWHDSEARALTRRTGFDLHLAKPIQLPDLLAALELGSHARRLAPSAA